MFSRIIYFPPGAMTEFFLFISVSRPAEAHPSSYPTDTEGSYPGSKAARAWSWLLTSI